MRYNGVYVAAEVEQAITGADGLIELQVPTNVQVVILRAWVSADQGTAQLDEGLTVELYANDGPATGGLGLTEQAVQGSADAASSVVALGGATVATTPVPLVPTIEHTQNGWLYVATPEEAERIAGGTTLDNIGTRFTAAPSASGTFSYGIKWGELA